jgi:hypothetical protein
LDPAAQGPYKSVPSLTATQLRQQFLNEPDRQYFMIHRASDCKPLGGSTGARGGLHGRGWIPSTGRSTSSWRIPKSGVRIWNCRLVAAKYLENRLDTRSIFAFTLISNIAERRALLKAGFCEVGALPKERYPVSLPGSPCVFFVWPSKKSVAEL